MSGFGKGHSRRCSCEAQLQSSGGLASACCQCVSVPGHMGPSTGLLRVPMTCRVTSLSASTPKGSKAEATFSSMAQPQRSHASFLQYLTESQKTTNYSPWRGPDKGMNTRRRGPLWRLVTIPLCMKSLPKLQAFHLPFSSPGNSPTVVSLHCTLDHSFFNPVFSKSFFFEKF